LKIAQVQMIGAILSSRRYRRRHNFQMTLLIRPAEQKDLPALSKFLVRVYHFDPLDPHANPQFLEWKYLHPRTGWEGSRSYLLEKNGEIAAHCGLCPIVFCPPDEKNVKSLTMMDWAADPSLPGVGVMLLRKLMELAPTSFIVGGATSTRRIVPRIRFRNLGEAVTYAAWVRPWSEFRLRSLTRRSTLRLLHGLSHPVRNRDLVSSGWKFLPVDRFDDSVSPILRNVKWSWTFCQRNLADLNYLLQCPSVRMRGFLLKRHGEVFGYFVLGISEWEAKLLDLTVNSSDQNDWNLACAAVTRAAQLDPAVCRVRILSTVPIMKRALAWNGYWCQYKEPIALYDPSDLMGNALPVSLQLFDGDSGY